MSGQQIIPLAVKDSFSGSSNTTHTVTEECEALSLINKGAAAVTVTVNSIAVVVDPGESYTAYYRDFTSIGIQATDNYKLVVMGR